MLPQLAEGDANKVFVVPSEFAQAFGGIGEALARGAGAGEPTPGAPPPRPRRRPRRRAPRRAGARRGTHREAPEPMFDSLAEKLQGTLAEVRSRGTLTEQDIDAAMREIRLALLEADVNFKVVASFTTQLKERCLGADVVGGLNPGQQVVKIVARRADRADGRRVRRADASRRARRP